MFRFPKLSERQRQIVNYLRRGATITAEPYASKAELTPAGENGTGVIRVHVRLLEEMTRCGILLHVQQPPHPRPRQGLLWGWRLRPPFFAASRVMGLGRLTNSNR